MKPSANLAIDRYGYAERVVSDYCYSNSSCTLFDIGAGDARFSELALPSLRWFGFDREAWGDVRCWDLSTSCPLGENIADVVFLLDVIEHLPNPGLELENIALAMKPGATLVITTVNPKWSASRLNFLFKGVLSGFSPHDLSENYHVLPIWPHVLDRFLRERGFQVESYVTLDGKTGLFKALGSTRGPVRWTLNALQMVIESADASACGMSYGFIARLHREISTKPSCPSKS